MLQEDEEDMRSKHIYIIRKKKDKKTIHLFGLTYFRESETLWALLNEKDHNHG